MDTVTAFLDRIDAYLKATGMTPTAFGRATVGDPNFVFDLRLGRSPQLRLVERVDTFMACNPPTDTAERLPSTGTGG